MPKGTRKRSKAQGRQRNRVGNLCGPRCTVGATASTGTADESGMRRCLGGGEGTPEHTFFSSHPGNRICNECRRATDFSGAASGSRATGLRVYHDGRA